MYPKKQFSTTVTAYTYHFDEQSETATFKRTVLKNTYWNMNGNTIRMRGGIAAPDHVTLVIPLIYNPGYAHTGTTGEGWRIGIGADMQASRIVKGECDWRFSQTENEALERELLLFEREFSGQIHLAKGIDEALDIDRQLQKVVITC